MAQSPEELKREIEQTRQDMSRDVDAISEKVSPGRIVQRSGSTAPKNAVSLGFALTRVDAGTGASSGASTISDKSSSAQSAVSDAG